MGGYPLGRLLVVGPAADFLCDRLVALWNAFARPHYRRAEGEKGGTAHNGRFLRRAGLFSVGGCHFPEPAWRALRIAVQKQIVIVGLNQRTAPIDVRESVAFENSYVAEALTRLHGYPAILEGVILSTCNRVGVIGAAGGASSG